MTRLDDDAATEPVFVLVRPQLAENIGAAARAMWNFGLARLRLVAPRDGWPSPRAMALASGAGRVLDQAGVFATLDAALADATHVYATTGRARDLTRRVLDPEAAMAEARARAAAGERVAVVFGPERTGLENDELIRAQTLVSVPVNPEFPSINLAQCALLLAYEWRRAGDRDPPPVAAVPDPAPRHEVERLAEHWQERLEAAGFFFPPEKADGMKANLRALWLRLPLTRADVQTLHGALRQIVRRPPGAGPG
jgi:tRNA/rRNA methyltransferase